MLKDLKDSTRQRMGAIEFGFPAPDGEKRSWRQRPGIDHGIAAQLVRFGHAIRRLETAGLREAASTRALIAAGRLITEGLYAREGPRPRGHRRDAH